VTPIIPYVTGFFPPSRNSLFPPPLIRFVLSLDCSVELVHLTFLKTLPFARFSPGLLSSLKHLKQVGCPVVPLFQTHSSRRVYTLRPTRDSISLLESCPFVFIVFAVPSVLLPSLFNFHLFLSLYPSFLAPNCSRF